jgi:hypothetical protein
MENSQKIEIQEDYRDFVAPFWVSKALCRLLDGIPEKYLYGLKTILLTNSLGLNRSQRRKKTKFKKHKVSNHACLGLYQQEWQGQPAKIELFTDNILSSFPALIQRIPFFQDLIMGDVLYHEVGHHIHKSSEPEYREREDVADFWRKKLIGIYFRKQYWYLRPLTIVLKPLVTVLQGLSRKMQAKANQAVEW